MPLVSMWRAHDPLLQAAGRKEGQAVSNVAQIIIAGDVEVLESQAFTDWRNNSSEIVRGKVQMLQIFALGEVYFTGEFVSFHGIVA